MKIQKGVKTAVRGAICHSNATFRPHLCFMCEMFDASLQASHQIFVYNSHLGGRHLFPLPLSSLCNDIANDLDSLLHL